MAYAKPKGRHPDKRLSSLSLKRLGPGRHADGNGLYLEVDTSGARRWVLRTVVYGRRRDLGLGSASIVPMGEAREQAARLRKVAREGGDPRAERDRGKQTTPTFEEAASRVHEEQVLPTSSNAKHGAQWLSTLRTYAFPTVGRMQVHLIDQRDVLRVLAPIWTEKQETARRVKQRLKTVFDWSIAAGHREGVNPVIGVEMGLARQRRQSRHFAALPWPDLPALMERLADASGTAATALRFLVLTAARSGEVRLAEWREVDLENMVWTIPAERMKARREHRVPLSNEVTGLLRAMRALARHEEGLVFPSAKLGRPLSDMTLSAVLKRLGMSVTVHGFRSTFRDWAEEATGFPHEVKEAALAHVVKNKAEAAYRRSDLFEKRRAMMDKWAAFAVVSDRKIVQLNAIA